MLNISKTPALRQSLGFSGLPLVFAERSDGSSCVMFTWMDAYSLEVRRYDYMDVLDMYFGFDDPFPATTVVLWLLLKHRCAHVRWMDDIPCTSKSDCCYQINPQRESKFQGFKVVTSWKDRFLIMCYKNSHLYFTYIFLLLGLVSLFIWLSTIMVNVVQRYSCSLELKCFCFMLPYLLSPLNLSNENSISFIAIKCIKGVWDAHGQKHGRLAETVVVVVRDGAAF